MISRSSFEYQGNWVKVTQWNMLICIWDVILTWFYLPKLSILEGQIINYVKVISRSTWKCLTLSAKGRCAFDWKAFLCYRTDVLKLIRPECLIKLNKLNSSCFVGCSLHVEIRLVDQELSFVLKRLKHVHQIHSHTTGYALFGGTPGKYLTNNRLESTRYLLNRIELHELFAPQYCSILITSVTGYTHRDWSLHRSHLQCLLVMSNLGHLGKNWKLFF